MRKPKDIVVSFLKRYQTAKLIENWERKREIKVLNVLENRWNSIQNFDYHADRLLKSYNMVFKTCKKPKDIVVSFLTRYQTAKLIQNWERKREIKVLNVLENRWNSIQNFGYHADRLLKCYNMIFKTCANQKILLLAF